VGNTDEIVDADVPKKKLLNQILHWGRMSLKYTKMYRIELDQNTTDATLTYDQLCGAEILINCRGSGPANAGLVTCKLFLPDMGVPLIRFARQYFQLQQIPINFLINRINRQLIGNAVLEVCVDNVLASRLKNAFYQIPQLVAPEPLLTSRQIYFAYSQSDEDAFKASLYYCEPLVPQRIMNGCVGC